MSLQPPSPSIDLRVTQASSVSSPTLSSGADAGRVFDGRGNDFLDPNNILNNVDGFSGSIRPVTSNTLTGQLSPANPFGKNPEAPRILGSTSSILSSILSPGFGDNIVFEVPIFPAPFIQPVPDLGVNPDPTRILLSTEFFAQNIQPPSLVNNPRNFNPLIWHNPNASNILLGSLGAQNNILGGTGLSFPPFNPFLTFSGGLSGIVPTAMASPILSVMPPLAQPMPSGLQFAGLGIQTSLFPVYTQPYVLAGSQTIQPYDEQVDLMAGMLSVLDNMTSLMSHAMRELVRTDASSATGNLYGPTQPGDAYAAGYPPAFY